jgi:hypothetical protein
LIGRDFVRLSCATAACALVIGIGVRAEQQSPTAAPAGPTAAEKYKNIQVLKNIPADQLPNAMQYITAALGVQCGFCHVREPDGWHFDADDRQAKGTARKMMQMMFAFNAGPNDITLTCATCHHGRQEPERTPPLAQELTPEEALLAQQRAPARGAGAQPQGGPGRQGGPEGRGQGRGGPQRPTETVDQVIDKYVQAMGGQQALAAAKSRVMQGTATTRDRQTVPFKVQEKASGEYRIDIDSKPAPTVRGWDGKTAWVQAFGNAHVLEGIQADQSHRLNDLGLPLAIKQRFTSVTVGRYGNVDGTPTIILVARNGDVTEQMQFARDSGLLLRRSILTRTPLGMLLEQVDYKDYRDADGLKAPYEVRYATWNQLSTEKFTDIKVNAPVEDAVFMQPAK